MKYNNHIKNLFHYKESIWKNKFNKFKLKIFINESKIYFGIIILGSFFTISINSIYRDSDFVLELKNVNKDPTISKLEIEVENVQEMCPTDKFKLEVTNSLFISPKPDNMTISHTISFNLKYNITTDANIDLTKTNILRN